MTPTRTDSGARGPHRSGPRITQAELREFVALQAAARRLRTVRAELVARLEAGAQVEPGPLVPTLTTTRTQLLTRAKLTALIGEENVAVFVEHIEPTDVRRIAVRETGRRGTRLSDPHD